MKEIAYRWAAQDDHTTDKIPYTGPLHAGAQHAYVTTGYGGWGMSNAVMSGRLLAALITGDSPPWAELYDSRRLDPLREAVPLLKAQATVAEHFFVDRLRSCHTGSMQDLDAGTAAIVRIGGERCAVYRDQTGNLHAVSAICTHLGCVVAFNDAEQAWECPCHGSRFATDGSVLQGPANRPLKSLDVTGWNRTGPIRDGRRSAVSYGTSTPPAAAHTGWMLTGRCARAISFLHRPMDVTPPGWTKSVGSVVKVRPSGRAAGVAPSWGRVLRCRG